MKKQVPLFIVFIITLTGFPVILTSSCQRKRTERAYHDNGKLMYEISYKGNMKNGNSTYYFTDGRVEIVYPYTDDELNGKVTRWYYNGNIEYEEHYRNNMLDGNCRRYLINGTLSEEKNYREGVLHGMYKVYWETGALKISGRYKEGLYDGKWEYFDEQGMKAGEATFTEGSGVMTGYHKNGRISREVSYRNNLKHGRERIWSPEGELIEQIIYTEGKVVTGNGRK